MTMLSLNNLLAKIGIGKHLEFEECSYHLNWKEWLTAPKWLVQLIWFMSNICFFLIIWNAGMCKAERAHIDCQ